MAGKLYVFDFDDNVAVTNATIRTQQGRISTAAYAMASPGSLSLREDAFVEFTRWRTCTLVPGPFFDTFVRALEEKAPVAVISARSHNQKEFRKLLRRTAKLGGQQLNCNVTGYCVNNGGIRKRYGKIMQTAGLKVKVLRDFLKRYPRSWSLGFSDDDPKNLRVMRKALRQECQSRRVCIYDARTKRKSVM